LFQIALACPKSSSSAAGGLALALRQAIQAPGGLWFGWSGRVNETPVKEPQIVTRRRVSYITLDLSRADYESFYVGYANSTLWPLLHFRLGFLEYRREEFEGYLDVNSRFAAHLAQRILPDDLIFVHDYHFIPFAAELRKLGSRTASAFSCIHHSRPPMCS
jgi:trehalose 6-phosphate synthase